MRPARFCLALALVALPAAARAQTAEVPPPPWETAALPAPARPLGPPRALQAADPEAEGGASLARLRSTLAWFEGNHRSMRLSMGITGIVAGAAAMVTGGLLLDRDRRNDAVYGMAIGAGGLGVIVGSSINLAMGDMLQPVRDSLEASERAGLSPADRLAAAEAEWARRADRSRRFRRVGGPILLGLGGLMLAGGMALLISRAGGSETLAYATGTMGITGGALTAVAGAGILFAPDPLEQSWEVYRRARGIGVDLALAPVPGGAMAGVSGTF